jgi:carbonic anhydrase
MSETDELLARTPQPAGSILAGLPRAPARHLAVVVCMDARVNVYRILGLRDGDAHVIRNAGGVVTDDVIRSLAISQRQLGTREIMLIQHTDCGLSTITDDGFKRALADEVGHAPTWPVGAFTDVEQNVRDSIARISASPFLPRRDSVRGFVYDVNEGSLIEVV